MSTTISISSELFQELCGQVLSSLARQGFRHIYLLNGHGANLEPLKNLKNSITDVEIRIRSWWDFKSVNKLRDKYFGDWEGMHATPSEISITRVNQREIQSSLAKMPPKKLSKKYPDKLTGPYGLDAMVSMTVYRGNKEKTLSFANRLFENGVIGFIAGSNPLRMRFLLPYLVLKKTDISKIMTIIEKTLIEEE